MNEKYNIIKHIDKEVIEYLDAVLPTKSEFIEYKIMSDVRYYVEFKTKIHKVRIVVEIPHLNNKRGYIGGSVYVGNGLEGKDALDGQHHNFKSVISNTLSTLVCMELEPTDYEFNHFTGVTHVNGGKAFAVHDDGRCWILKADKFMSDVSKIHKGEDNCAMLLERPDSYTYVGKEYYTFTSPEPITNFYGEIGNSDVPYPYAESENYYYMFLDKVYFKKEDIDFLTMFKGNHVDFYAEYYEYRRQEKLNLIDMDIIENSESYRDFEDRL